MMVKRDPLKIPKRKRLKTRPYTKEMSVFYDYREETTAPTKTELKLYRERYTGKPLDKIVKNPFQRGGFLGLRRR